MNRGAKLTLALWAVGVCTCFVGQTTHAQDQWRLGMQAYSFNRFTFYEAVEKNRILGMKYIEAYPGQRLSTDHGDAKFDHTMSTAQMLEVKQMLKAQGVTLVNYGVVGLPNDETECRKVFAFAKAMGIETIVSEPPENAFDLIDTLCKEYKIGVALHNHPKPSPYWDYKTVLRLCEGRSPWIGACADTGHWTRSGIDPVEAIRALGMAGRIRSLHFKDLNEFGVHNAHDVPWGQGKSKTREVLGALATMGYEGSFSIEYEHNWLNSMPEIAQCVAFFQETAFELGVRNGRRIFNGENLDEWTTKPGSGKNMWVAGKAQVSTSNSRQLATIDGTGELINLAPKHGASLDIYSKAKFGDCRIELEVMVPKGSNSGVYLMGEYEVQVLDSFGKMKVGNGDIGAIYGGFAPPVNASKAPGQWQQFVIDWRAPKFDAEGKKIKNAEFVKVELNGQILHKNLVMERQTPGGLTGKEAPTGPLMFQGNHGPVAYRNIVVTPMK